MNGRPYPTLEELKREAEMSRLRKTPAYQRLAQDEMFRSDPVRERMRRAMEPWWVAANLGEPRDQNPPGRAFRFGQHTAADVQTSALLINEERAKSQAIMLQKLGDRWGSTMLMMEAERRARATFTGNTFHPWRTFKRLFETWWRG